MPSKWYLENENRKLEARVSRLEHDIEIRDQRWRSEVAQKDGYIRALKVLIKIFPQFTAYRREDVEDDWRMLAADLIAEDMNRISSTRDQARQHRLFGATKKED